MGTLKHYPAKKTNTSYAVPDGVTLLDEYSFSGCANLQSVTIPGSVTVISDGVFTDCERLAEINVDENNSDYKSIDGVLFTKEDVYKRQGLSLSEPQGRSEPDPVAAGV